jgi:DNA polymerase V
MRGNSHVRFLEGRGAVMPPRLLDYASSEKAFDPSIRDKPVVVLSNNDGCVIARSEEAKKLGIKMGQPAHLSRKFFSENGVVQFSSNYTLYADMSNRVMSILSEFAPEFEIYSVDEAFLDLTSFSHYDLEKYALQLREMIKQWTGLAVSIGIAPTKTLAKVANRSIKKKNITSGVLMLKDQLMIDQYLKEFKVEDIWGIGKQHAAFLKSHHITTALEMARANPEWIQKNLTVVGRRTQMELLGSSCIPLETAPPAKKGISTTRCFGKDVFDFEEIREALTSYITRACEKLRNDKLHAGKFTLILHTNVFRKDVTQYSSSIQHKLSHHTSSTNEILTQAIPALRSIFKEGICYYKTGIIFTNLKPEKEFQLNFLDQHNREKMSALMKSIDTLNKDYGRSSVKYGAEGTEKKWRLKINHLSRHYTTDIHQVIRIKV